MQILLTLRMIIDDPADGRARRFTKSVKADLPHVPRIGEGVIIPGIRIFETMGARRVDDVIYPLDGTVMLDFKLDGLTNEVASQIEAMQAAGFAEV